MESPSTPPRRDAGMTMIEVMVAIAILAIVLMSAGLTVLMGVQSQDESEQSALALWAVRDICAEIQEQVNEAQDLSALSGVGATYVNYQGLKRSVPQLPDGVIAVEIFADEPNVPTRLGGPQDLNFDGDTEDNLANQSSGSDLKIVPVEITVAYTDDRGTISRTFQRRFSQTTD